MSTWKELGRVPICGRLFSAGSGTYRASTHYWQYNKAVSSDRKYCAVSETSHGEISQQLENKKMHMKNRSKEWKVSLSNFLDNISGHHCTLLQTSQIELVEGEMPPSLSCWWLPEPVAPRQHPDDTVPTCVCHLALQSERMHLYL